MIRYLAPVLAAMFALPAAFGEGQPQTITLQPPKSNVTLRLVTFDTTGAPTAEGQKVLDQMIEEGWRAAGVTTISSGNPVTVAIMFLKNTRPPVPPPGALGQFPGGPQGGPPGQGGGQLPPGAAQPPGFGPQQPQGLPPGAARPPLHQAAPPPAVNEHNP